MSAARMVLRLATARALAGQTLAEGRIFDSTIDPLDLRMQRDPSPVLVIYTDDHEGDGGPAHQMRMQSDIDLVVEMAVAGTARIDSDGQGPEVEVAVPHTDAGLELQLDIMERQVIAALTGSASAWADIWRSTVLNITRVMSRRGAAGDTGPRFAVRQLTLTVRTVHDPEPGHVVAAGSVWRAFLDAATADAEMSTLAPALQAVIESGTLPDWRRRAAAIGVSRDAAVLLGFGPLSGTADDPQLFDEFEGGGTVETVAPNL